MSFGPAKGATHAKDGTPYKKRGPAKGTVRKRWLSEQPELVREMHALHLEGVNLFKLGKQFGYVDSNIKKAFERLNLEVKLDENLGRFLKTVVPLTDDELIALAAKQTRIMVPLVIKTEWRKWTMEKRAWWIQLIRGRGIGGQRPAQPFSSNVEPFDYTTANCHELAKKRNGSTNSQMAPQKVKISSQGVIWDDRLWFWVNNTGYVEGVRWTQENGRLLLKRAIYEKHHGPLPVGHVVRQVDGNPNNLDPQNLTLATRNDVCRENHTEALTKRSRENVNALLNFKPNGLTL